MHRHIAAGEEVYIWVIDFSPWKWRIFLVKDAAEFEALLTDVQHAYVACVVVIAVVALFYWLWMRRIVLVLDNYIIHKTRAVKRWLANNPKFELLFQPVYHPWVNQIERLWKAMHDTVTRNHQCRTLTDLCQHIARFLDVVQPFPGNGQSVARLGSAI